MGIMGALSTAVSGLSVQSYALENISGNIANSQTVGYKRVNTNFVDFVPEAPAQHETSGSVVSYSQLTNTLQGTTQSTGVPTNLALSGDGFFAVSQNTGTIAAPAFTGANMYTRRGDFSKDANGFLVNGAGYFLNGTSFDPSSGSVISPATSPIRISDASLPAVATTEIDYTGNLPTLPKPGSYNASASGSGSTATEAFTPLTAGQTINFTVDGKSISLQNTPPSATTVSYPGSGFTPLTGGTTASITVDGVAISLNSTNGDTLAHVRDAINTALTGAGKSGDVAAAVDGSGNLVLTNGTTGANTGFTITNAAAIFGASAATTNTGAAGLDTGSTAAKAAAAIQSQLTAAGDTAVTVAASGTNIVFTRTAHDTIGAPVAVGATGNFSPSGTTTGSVDASYLIKASDFDATVNPVTGTGSNQAVLAQNNTAFVNESIDGGQVVVYDSAGTPSTVQVRWAKVSDATSSTPSEWKMFYESNSNASAGTVQWSYAGTANFDRSGNLTAPASPSSFSLGNLTIDGTAVGNVTLDLSKGLTQFNDANGTTTTTMTQNGSAVGTLTSVAVGNDGTVSGTYSNGQTAVLARVTVAHFTNPNGLKTENGGAFSATSSSGSPSYGLGSTTLVGGSVEESNTDISDEFSKMIVTQQAYSANTKVMTTAQSMLQDVINIIR